MDCLREKLDALYSLQANGVPSDGIAEALSYCSEEDISRFALPDGRWGRCKNCAAAMMAYTMKDGKWMVIQVLIGVKDYTPDWLCPGEQARALEDAKDPAHDPVDTIRNLMHEAAAGVQVPEGLANTIMESVGHTEVQSSHPTESTGAAEADPPSPTQ